MPDSPPGDNSDTERYEAVAALVREHSKRYRPAELRSLLIANGYDPADVDRAMNIPPPERQAPAWPLTVAAIQIAITVVVTLKSRNFLPMIVIWALWIGCMGGVAGALFARLRQTRRLGTVLVVGIVLCEVVVTGVLALVVGLCSGIYR